MAGAGYKLFNTGDVLTAAQVNTYLQEQTVMVFASSTARTTALSGVLAEGMVSYLQDTNAVEVYNGSAWVGVSGAGDVTEVQAGTGISVASGTGPIPVVTNTMATAIDAKGDLIVGTGADTFSRLAVGGTNGHTLQVDSSTSTGLKWAAAAGDKNFSLINTGGTNLTGAGTVTVSGISGKDMLHIEVRDASSANASSFIYIRFNSDTGNNYSQRGMFLSGNSATTIIFNNIDTAAAEITMARMGGNAADTMSGTLMVYGANTAGIKPFQIQGSATDTYLSSARGYVAGGHWSGSATISSVSFITSTGNWDAGSVFIYGA